MATVEVKIPIYYARKQRYALEESYSKLREAKQNYQASEAIGAGGQSMSAVPPIASKFCVPQ